MESNDIRTDRPLNGEMFINNANANSQSFIEGSTQAALLPYVGSYVIVEFLIGTQNFVTRSGKLYAVGAGYIVLLDESTGSYTLCDFYSIKFMTFVDPSRTDITQFSAAPNPDPRRQPRRRQQ